MPTATYTKLKDGSWGLRYPGAVTKGATVDVRKKDGSIRHETIKAVLWTGADSKTGQTISLCAVGQRESKSGGCGCDEPCCRPRCHCEPHCNCRGGNVYDC